MSDSSSIVNNFNNKSNDLEKNTMSYFYLVGAMILGVIFLICSLIIWFTNPDSTKVTVEDENKTTDPKTMALVSLVLAFFIVALSYLNYIDDMMNN